MSIRIDDGYSLFGVPVSDWWRHQRLAGPNGPLRRFGEPLPLTEVADAEPLQARIYEGVWIVDCPCGGADYVWTNTALTQCASCGNMAHGRRWRRVALPAERAEIEAALLARPVPATRNWWPGETAADLLAENKREGGV